MTETAGSVAKGISDFADVDETARALHLELDANRDQRVVIVGTVGSGKKTLFDRLKETFDLDGFLGVDEPHRWTPAIGAAMASKANENFRLEPGKPVFSSVVLRDADVIIALRVDDATLKERAKRKSIDFGVVKGMQAFVDASIAEAVQRGVKVVDVYVGERRRE